MAAYSFLTTWCLDAALDDVWEAIFEVERYPEWWRGVESVVPLEPGGEDGVGRLDRLAWRSRLPYRLEFDLRVTRIERPHLIEAHASGELAGTGVWRLYGGNGTAVVYSWNVSTTRPWMNALAPLARPVFAWNHDVVMRQGGEGLARRVGARLLAHD